MARTIHSARVTGPMTYRGDSGKQRRIPLGPCLVEWGDGRPVDIIWGASGQNCAALPVAEMHIAEDAGRLVMVP